MEDASWRSHGESSGAAKESGGPRGSASAGRTDPAARRNRFTDTPDAFAEWQEDAALVAARKSGKRFSQIGAGGRDLGTQGGRAPDEESEED